MNDATQNASVDRACPWWNRITIGFLVGFAEPAAGCVTPARARRNAVDSGRYFSSSGTSTSAGNAPMMNIDSQPHRGISRMPSSAVATAPTW